MSHVLDRLRFFKKVQSTFSNGHGIVTNEDRQWEDAFAVHVTGLNARSGFAGHTDWRLPNVNELQSIVNYETSSPAVSLAFHDLHPIPPWEFRRKRR